MADYGSGHLHGVVLDGRSVIDFERDKLHREIKRQFGATETIRSYDTLSRLNELNTHSPLIGDDEALKRKHHYDLAGQLVRIDTPKGPHAYGYDKAGRLIAASQPGLENQRYRFDPAGNRLFESTEANMQQGHWEDTVRQNMQDKGFNLLGKNAAKDQHNTAPKWMDNRITDDGEYRYEYDRWGNTTKKYKVEGNEQHHYHYDSNHRLIRYELESDAAVRGANYHYDPFGRRVVKQVQEADAEGQLQGELQTTFFGWDGDRLVLTEKENRLIHTIYEPGSFVPMIRVEGDKKPPKRTLAQKLQKEQGIRLDRKAKALFDTIEHELRESQLSEFNRQWMQQSRVQPDTLRAMLDELPTWQGRHIHLYRCDHLGTPVALINEQGETEWSAILDPWGRTRTVHDPNTLYQAIRLPGQQEDAESGMHYNRHRYYDPIRSNYVTSDPIGFVGGLNFSIYSLNPVSSIDPLGLWASQKGFYVHQRAGYLVFGKEISQSQLAAVARGHVWADSPEHQTSEFTYMHAMKRPGQSKIDACEDANSYIKNQARKALDAKAAGKMNDAFFHFGAALHAIQDSTSPSHAGFQEWSGQESFGEQASHAVKEMLVPDSDSLLFQQTRRAWEAFKEGDINGFSCLCN